MAGRPVNGGLAEDSAATTNGRSWPNAPIAEPRLNGRCRSVTDIGFVGHRTEKGRLPPTNSVRSWRPETGRPEIEHRGFTTTRRSAADQFELRLLSQSHGLSPSVPRLGGIGDPCRTRHRRPGSVVFCRPVLSGNSQQGLCNDADHFALLALPQVQCQSSTPACCVPVIAICASI